MAENQASSIVTRARKPTATQKRPTTAEDKKAYICQTCSRNFVSSQARRDHCFATKHLVYCSVCEKGFVNHEGLLQHASIHAIDAMINRSGARNSERMVPQHDVNGQPSQLESSLVSAEDSLTSQAFRKGGSLQQIFTPPAQVIVPKDGLLHKSNIYTLLSNNEQETIYKALLAACHSTEILIAARYTLQGRNERISHTNVPYLEFRPTPQAVGKQTRKVVAIDCEMVGLWKNAECVALLSAVDVLTGETLLDTYVNPIAKVYAWRSSVSGVTRQAMSEAIEKGQALHGWVDARNALWKHIDAETVLVGHALQNDLNVLGIFHPRIVDTAILASQAVFPEIEKEKFPQSYGLKRLLLGWLEMTIQTGKKGHDCLEDTLATRELAIWCARDPDRLRSWGSQMRVVYEARKLAIQQAREEAKKRAEEEAKNNANDGAEKVVIAGIKKDIKEKFVPQDRQDDTKAASKNHSRNRQREAKTDTQMDAKNDGKTEARKHIRKDVEKYTRERYRKQYGRNANREEAKAGESLKNGAKHETKREVNTSAGK